MIQLAVVTSIDGVVTVSREEVEGLPLDVGENLYEGDILDTSNGSLQVKLASGLTFNIPQGQSFTVTLDNLAEAHVEAGSAANSEEPPQNSRAKYYAMLAAVLLLAVMPAVKFLTDHKDPPASDEDDIDDGGNAMVLSAMFGLAQVLSGFLTRGLEFLPEEPLQPPSGGDEETPKPVPALIPTLSLAPSDAQPETGTKPSDAPLWPIGEGGIPFIIPIAFPFSPVLAGFPTQGIGYAADIPYPFGIFYVLSEPPEIPIIERINFFPSINPETPIFVDYRSPDSSYGGALNAVVGGDSPGTVTYDFTQTSFFNDVRLVVATTNNPSLGPVAVTVDGEPLFFHLTSPTELVASRSETDPTQAAFTIVLDQDGDAHTKLLDRIDGLLYDTLLTEPLPVIITDNNGDTAQGSFQYLFDLARFIVGENQEDIPGSETKYVIGENPDGSTSGAIFGASTADLLIGDGGTLDIIENQATFIFVADTSTSMLEAIPTNISPPTDPDDPLFDDYNPDGTISRIGALKQAFEAAMVSLNTNSTGNEAINVILIEFNRTATFLGKFEITQTSELENAIAAIQGLSANDALTGTLHTNYEAALLEIINQIEDPANTFIEQSTIKQVVIATDGRPNLGMDNDILDAFPGDPDLAVIDRFFGAINQVEGTDPPTADPPTLQNPQLGDDSDEISAIEIDLFASEPNSPANIPFQIDAIGISLENDTLSLSNLVRLESNRDERPADPSDVDPNDATNAENAQDLIDEILSLSVVTFVGEGGGDDISGHRGQDVIFGDALNTDWFIIEQGLLGEVSLGSNADVYVYLEQNVAGWGRKETTEHILANQVILAEEDQVNVLRAGDDTLRGGAQNDVIYAQGGNDIVDGGLGNDLINPGSADIFAEDQLLLAPEEKGNIVTGGGEDTADTFVFTVPDLSRLGTKTRITDWEPEFDLLVFSDLIDGGNSGVANGEADKEDLTGDNGIFSALDFASGEGGTIVTFQQQGASIPSSSIVFVGITATSLEGLVADTNQIQYQLDPVV